MIRVYGSSDDLVEVDGDIREEFNCIDIGDDGGRYLGFSDGTVLHVDYTGGCWRIRREAKGTARYKHRSAVGPDDDNYSDRIELSSDKPIRWVVFGAYACICRRKKSQL